MSVHAYISDFFGNIYEVYASGIDVEYAHDSCTRIVNLCRYVTLPKGRGGSVAPVCEHEGLVHFLAVIGAARKAKCISPAVGACPRGVYGDLGFPPTVK